MLGPIPAFTHGCTILDRLAALDREPPSPTMASRAMAAVPLLGLASLLAVTVAAWTTFTHHGLLGRSEEHTSELQSLMRISYAVFCLKKKTKIYIQHILTLYTHLECLSR